MNKIIIKLLSLITVFIASHLLAPIKTPSFKFYEEVSADTPIIAHGQCYRYFDKEHGEVIAYREGMMGNGYPIYDGLSVPNCPDIHLRLLDIVFHNGETYALCEKISKETLAKKEVLSADARLALIKNKLNRSSFLALEVNPYYDAPKNSPDVLRRFFEEFDKLDGQATSPQKIKGKQRKPDVAAKSITEKRNDASKAIKADDSPELSQGKAWLLPWILVLGIGAVIVIYVKAKKSQTPKTIITPAEDLGEDWAEEYSDNN